MADESVAWTWKDVVARLREAPIGSTVQIAVTAIEEPASVGLYPMPTGADGRPVFGVVLDDQVGIWSRCPAKAMRPVCANSHKSQRLRLQRRRLLSIKLRLCRPLGQRRLL